MAGTIVGNEHSFITPNIIAMEALFRLKQALVLPRMASHRFEKYFGRKIGDTLTVKRPYQARVTKGREISPSPMIDKTVEIKVDQRYSFAIEYADDDMTLNIVDFYNRYLRVGVEELAYTFDEAGANELGTGLHIFNAPGGSPGSSITTKSVLEVRAHANEMAIPHSDTNFGLLNPFDFVELSDNVKSVNSPMMIEQTIRKRYRGEIGSWMVFESTRLPTMSVPQMDANLLVMGANQDGTEIMVDGVGSTERAVLKKGNLIQFANVFEIQPRGNRKRTGNLATFTVVEDLTLTNTNARTGTLKISPELIAADSTVADPAGGTALNAGGFQNVSNRPADNAIITRLGGSTAGGEKTYRQGLFFDKYALEYVNVQLHEFDSAVTKGHATDPETGLSVRLLGGTDVRKAEELQRLDILYGVKTMYPEVGIRLILDEV